MVVVLTALGEGAALHSLDTREAVEDYLAAPPGDQLGLGVQGMLSLLRVAGRWPRLCGGRRRCSAGSRCSAPRAPRLALSVLAAPLFVTSFLYVGSPAGIVPAMVSAAVVMLWFQPARDWFDGIAREAPAPPRPLPAPPTTPTGRDPLLDLPPPTAPPLHPTPYAAAPPPTATAARPASVTWACVLAWLSTAAVFGLLGLVLVVMLASPRPCSMPRTRTPTSTRGA